MLGFNGGRIGSKNVIEQNGVVGPSSDPNYDDVGLILNGGDFIDGSKYQATVTSTGVDLDSGTQNFSRDSYSVVDNDVFQAPDQGQFDLGTNDFTIEGWVYRNSASSNDSFRTIFGKRKGSGGGIQYLFFALYLGNRFYIWGTSNGSTWNIANTVNTGVALGADTWTHYAVCREGSSIRVFIAGTLATTITTSASIINDSTSPFQIGTDGSANAFDGGRLAGIRVTNGTARYTANFTPPTAVFDTAPRGFKASGVWTIPEVSRLRRALVWPGDNPVVLAGLVLYVDAGNTSSYPGSGTTWTNIAPGATSNNVTLVNGPTFSSADGGSIDFDGINDFGTTGSPLDPVADGLFADSSSSWSVTSFFNADTTAGTDAITGKGGGTGAAATYFVIRDGNKIKARLRGGTIATIATISANTWYEVTVTWDGSTAKSYLNGVYATNISVGTAAKQNNNFNIGATASGNSIRFNGKISVTLVYNKALTASEVTQNFDFFKGRYGL
jgi:hypothetical protein